MPRFTGQNKKNIDPRYFLNEKREVNEAMNPLIAALMTLKPGAQVRLSSGEVAEIVDTLKPGLEFEVAIDGGDESRYITIHDIDMSSLKGPGNLKEQDKFEKLAPGATKSDVLLAQTISQFEKYAGRLRATFYPSVMYRILRKDGVSAAMEYLQGGQHLGGERLMAQMQSDLGFIKQTIDLEVKSRGGEVGPNFQPSRDKTPFRDQQMMSRGLEEAPRPKGRMEKTDRFKEGDKVKHRELGTGRVVSRGGAHKNNVGIRWDKDGKQKPSTVDHNSLRKA